MFIATFPKNLIAAPAEPDVAAARIHCAPLERGPRAVWLAINIWSLRDKAIPNNTLLPQYEILSKLDDPSRGPYHISFEKFGRGPPIESDEELNETRNSPRIRRNDR